MAGDKVQISTYAFYNTAVQPPPGGVDLTSELLSLLSSGVVNNSAGKITSTSAVSTAVNPGVTNFLTNNRPYDNAKPKAYLNWILFDNQFNYVASNSGVQQAQPGASKQALVAPLQTIAKNGYLYVYVSNESQQDVYFDDLNVKHYTGPLVQEQSYYPFGLQMAGISDKALNKLSSQYKFNGGVELEEEFGVNLYSTFFRQYDPQLGRFSGVDILSEATYGLNPYQFGGNNPVIFNDPTGALMERGEGRMQKGPDGNYHVPWLTEILWNNWGFFDLGESGGQGYGGGNYTNIRGMNSEDILSQMSFGDKFVQNKSGEYGFWRKYNFDPGSEAFGNVLAGVGAGVSWVSLTGFESGNSGRQKFPDFLTIWLKYGHNMNIPAQQCPTTDPRFYNKNPPINCCAVRLSAALRKAGVDFSSYKGIKTADGLPTLADELRNWLIENMVGVPEMLSAAEFSSKYWNNDSAHGIVWMDLDGSNNHIDVFFGGNSKPFGSRATRAGTSGTTQVYFWQIPANFNGAF
jgi:RHS repeat-associated protein